MTKRRILYFVTIVVAIGLGLGARAGKKWFPDVVNLYLGDALYAFMMYYIMGFIFPSKRFRFRFSAALLICYMIEASQLYQANWINAIRSSLPGRLILGSGFLWSDLLAYLMGCAVALIVDKLCLGRNK